MSNATAIQTITDTLNAEGWTITQVPAWNSAALRAYQDNGRGRELTVYTSEVNGQYRPHGFEAVIDGESVRIGNVNWLTEHIVAVITGAETVTVTTNFGLLVDGQAAGTFNTFKEVNDALAEAFAQGAVKVEIERVG